MQIHHIHVWGSQKVKKKKLNDKERALRDCLAAKSIHCSYRVPRCKCDGFIRGLACVRENGQSTREGWESFCSLKHDSRGEKVSWFVAASRTAAWFNKGLLRSFASLWSKADGQRSPTSPRNLVADCFSTSESSFTGQSCGGKVAQSWLITCLSQEVFVHCHGSQNLHLSFQVLENLGVPGSGIINIGCCVLYLLVSTEYCVFIIHWTSGHLRSFHCLDGPNT